MATMQRASYQLIFNKYKARGKGNVRLTQSSLLLTQPLSPDNKTYTFPMLTSEAQNGVDPNEIRLNLNDEFTAYEVGYYLHGGGAVAGSSPVVLGGLYWPYAPLELNANLVALEEAWNAVMNISINNVTRLEKWDMLKHKVVPRTQYANSSTGIPNATQPSINFERDGCILMQPMVTFSGAKKNLVTIQTVNSLSNSITFNLVTVSGTLNMGINKMVIIFRGMLAQNAAKFQ